jgi:hypothetical protein
VFVVAFFGFCQSQKQKKATTNTPLASLVARPLLPSPTMNEKKKNFIFIPSSLLDYYVITTPSLNLYYDFSNKHVLSTYN